MPPRPNPVRRTPFRRHAGHGGLAPVRLDAEQHVGVQAECLISTGRAGSMTIGAHRPLAGDAAILERRLANQVDLDHAADTSGGPHEHVVGILVGRWPGVRGDGVGAAARADRQRVAHDHPARGRPPRRDECVRPRLIDPVTGHVDPVWGKPEPARAPVEQRAEHAR